MSRIGRMLPVVVVCLSALIGVSVLAKPKPTPVPAREKTYGQVVVREVVRVLDGETFIVNLKDCPPIIGEQITVRLYGVNCPDLRDPQPAIRKLAARARQVTIAELRSAKVIRLTNLRRDKTFRILADVEIDGHSLAKTLLDGGYAKPASEKTQPR